MYILGLNRNLSLSLVTYRQVSVKKRGTLSHLYGCL